MSDRGRTSYSEDLEQNEEMQADQLAVNTNCSCHAHNINQNSPCYESNILSNIIKFGKQYVNTFPKLNIKCVETELRNIGLHLGNSNSQTDVRVISCIPIDVTDLQKKIIELEKKLYESNFQLHYLRQQNKSKHSVSDIDGGSDYDKLISNSEEKTCTIDNTFEEVSKTNEDKIVYQVQTTNSEFNAWLPLNDFDNDNETEIYTFVNCNVSQTFFSDTVIESKSNNKKPSEIYSVIFSSLDKSDILLNQNDNKEDSEFSDHLKEYTRDFFESDSYLRTSITENNLTFESESTILTETRTESTTLTNLTHEKSEMDKRNSNVRQYKIKSADLENSTVDRSKKSERKRGDLFERPKDENHFAKQDKSRKTASLNAQEHSNRRSSKYKSFKEKHHHQHENNFIDIILKDSCTSTDIQSHADVTSKYYTSQDSIAYKDLINERVPKYGSHGYDGVSKNNKRYIENYSAITQFSEPICRDTDEIFQNNTVENDIIMAKEICSCCTSKSRIVRSNVAESLYPKDHGKVDEGPDSFYKKVDTKIAGHSTQTKSPDVAKREGWNCDNVREYISRTYDKCDAGSVCEERKNHYDAYSYRQFQVPPVTQGYRQDKYRPKTGDGLISDNHYEPGIQFDEHKYSTRSVRDVSNYKMGVNDKYSIVSEMRNRFPLLENLSATSSDNSIDLNERAHLFNPLDSEYPFPEYPKMVQRNQSRENHLYRNDSYDCNQLWGNGTMNYGENQFIGHNVNRNIERDEYYSNEQSIPLHHRQFSDNQSTNIDPEDFYTKMVHDSRARYNCDKSFPQAPHNFPRKSSPQPASSDHYSNYSNMLPCDNSKYQKEKNLVAQMRSSKMSRNNSTDKILKIKGILSTCLRELEGGDIDHTQSINMRENLGCQCRCNCERQCSPERCNHTNDYTDLYRNEYTVTPGVKSEIQSKKCKRNSQKSNSSCLSSHKDASDNDSNNYLSSTPDKSEKNLCKSKQKDERKHQCSEGEPLKKKSHKHPTDVENKKKSARNLKEKSSKKDVDHDSEVSETKKHKSKKSLTSKETFRDITIKLEHGKLDKSNVSNLNQNKSVTSINKDKPLRKKKGEHSEKRSSDTPKMETSSARESSRRSSLSNSKKHDLRAETSHNDKSYKVYDLQCSSESNQPSNSTMVTNRDSSTCMNKQSKRHLHGDTKDQSKKLESSRKKSRSKSRTRESMVTETSENEKSSENCELDSIEESSKQLNSTLCRSNESSSCINKHSTKYSFGKSDDKKKSDKINIRKEPIKQEKSKKNQKVTPDEHETSRNIFKYFYKKKFPRMKKNKNILLEPKDSVDNLFPLPIIPVIQETKSKKNKKDVICLNVSHIVYPKLIGEKENMKTVLLYTGDKKANSLKDSSDHANSSHNTSTTSLHKLSKKQKRERSNGVILPLEMSQMYINCINSNYTTKKRNEKHVNCDSIAQKCILKKVVKKIKAMNEMSASYEKLGHNSRAKEGNFRNYPVAVQQSQSLQYILKNRDEIDCMSQSMLDLSSEKHYDNKYKIKKKHKSYASPKQIILDSMNISSQPLTNKFEKMNMSFTKKNGGDSKVFSILNKTLLKSLKKVGEDRSLTEAKTQTSKSDLPKKKNLFQQILKPKTEIKESKEIKPTAKDILTGKTVKEDSYTKQIRNIFWYPKEYERTMEAKKSSKPKFFEVQHKMPVSSMLRTLQGKELPKFGLPKLSPV